MFFYPKEDTLKILCWYLNWKCVRKGGSRRGLLWGHWGFLIGDMDDRVIPDVINDVFFTLRKIPFAFNFPAWSSPNLSSSCLSPPFHLPYFSSPWETWERPSPPPTRHHHCYLRSLNQYHHFPHQVPHNLFHHHAHTLTLGSKLILKLTSALVPVNLCTTFLGTNELPFVSWRGSAPRILS